MFQTVRGLFVAWVEFGREMDKMRKGNHSLAAGGFGSSIANRATNLVHSCLGIPKALSRKSRPQESFLTASVFRAYVDDDEQLKSLLDDGVQVASTLLYIALIAERPNKAPIFR